MFHIGLAIRQPFTAVLHSYRNANHLKDDKAGLGRYFKEKISRAQQHGSTPETTREGIQTKISCSPNTERLSQLQGVVHQTKDLKLPKFKLESKQIKGTQR